MMYLLPAQSTIGRILSYGGGVQSNALLVLAAQGVIYFDALVFANVGADSENPDTLRYIEEVAKPYAAAHGIRFVEVQKTRFGEPDTLYQAVMRSQRDVPLPVYMAGGAPGNRKCTTEYKLRVIDRWCKQQHWTHVEQSLGISWDEWKRARDGHWHDHYGKQPLGYWKRRRYPLLERRLTRADCLRIVSEAGLPQPPKSSCFFCPYHRPAEWIEIKRTQPALFWRAVAMEKHMNEVRENLGRDAVYLHRALVPLDQAVGDQLPMFPEWDTCDEGVCFV